MSRRRTDRLVAGGRPHGGALRPFLTLAVAGGLLVSACAGADAGAPSDEPSQPTRGSVAPPASQHPPGAEPRPTIVTPVAGRRERAVPWKLIATRDGGRRLQLEVTLGGPPCDALTAVSVRERRSAVTITVHAGRVPGARCGPGVEAVVGTFRVVAQLREPLGGRRLRGGARPG